MTRPRFLHAADLHLGAPLLSLGRRLDDGHAESYRWLARKALDNLVDTAISRAVDFVVLAGDIYDDADREVSAQIRFANALGRLRDAEIPVFIVHGNHDPVVTSYRPAAALPPNVTVFEPGRVTTHVLGLADGTEIAVAGTSFGRVHESENLAARFATIDTGGRRCVGVLHANVEGTVGHDPYAPCSVDDLRAAPVHYWALGHVHLRTLESLGHERWWAYSGNLQGRSTKPSECGPKGVLVAEFTADGVAEAEFAACDAVRFERIDVDVSEAADAGDVFDLAAEQIRRHAEDAGPIPLLIRLGLTGATAAHGALIDESMDLTALMRDSHPDCIGEGAILAVTCSTTPAISRAQLLDRQDLLAAVLQRLDELRAGGADVIDAAVFDDLGSTISHRRTRELLTSARGRAPGLGADVLDAVEQRLISALVEHR
jgi:exonuclease SbcD